MEHTDIYSWTLAKKGGQEFYYHLQMNLHKNVCIMDLAEMREQVMSFSLWRVVGNFTFSRYLSLVFQCFWCETAGASRLACLAGHLCGKPVLPGCYLEPCPLPFCSFYAYIINLCQCQLVWCFLEYNRTGQFSEVRIRFFLFTDVTNLILF